MAIYLKILTFKVTTIWKQWQVQSQTFDHLKHLKSENSRKHNMAFYELHADYKTLKN